MLKKTLDTKKGEVSDTGQKKRAQNQNQTSKQLIMNCKTQFCELTYSNDAFYSLLQICTNEINLCKIFLIFEYFIKNERFRQNFGHFGPVFDKNDRILVTGKN